MAEKAPKITKIEPAIASLPIRKRVAAYARVSMETDRLVAGNAKRKKTTRKTQKIVKK